MRRAFVRDRDRKTSDAFRIVRETATKVERLRAAAGETTEDARAIAAAGDVLGVLVGLLDAFDRHRARGTPVEIVKVSGAAPIGLFLRVSPDK